MNNIIQFPIKHSNAYNGYIESFRSAETPEFCEAYINLLNYDYMFGNITINELYELTKIGKEKKQDLIARSINTPGTYNYTPEMGQKKPANCQMTSTLSWDAKHYYVDTELELKGRGIRKEGENNGINSYRVTKLAYKKLEQQYIIASKCYLD